MRKIKVTDKTSGKEYDSINAWRSAVRTNNVIVRQHIGRCAGYLYRRDGNGIEILSYRDVQSRFTVEDTIHDKTYSSFNAWQRDIFGKVRQTNPVWHGDKAWFYGYRLQKKGRCINIVEYDTSKIYTRGGYRHGKKNST